MKFITLIVSAMFFFVAHFAALRPANDIILLPNNRALSCPKNETFDYVSTFGDLNCEGAELKLIIARFHELTCTSSDDFNFDGLKAITADRCILVNDSMIQSMRDEFGDIEQLETIETDEGIEVVDTKNDVESSY